MRDAQTLHPTRCKREIFIYLIIKNENNDKVIINENKGDILLVLRR